MVKQLCSSFIVLSTLAMRGRCNFDHKHNVALRAQYQMCEYNFTTWMLGQADTIHSKLKSPISSSSVMYQITCLYINYRQISNISNTNTQNINVSRLVLQLSLPKLLKPGFKSRMKMELEQRRQAILQVRLSDQHFHCPLRYVLY